MLALPMGLLQALGKAFSQAADQVTQPGSPTQKDIHFTTNFYLKAKSWGLSEKDARDVYAHGSMVKPNMMVRKYNGYEIGIWFFKDTVTGQAIITSIWKRGRR
jgi:hypothetical protein